MEAARIRERRKSKRKCFGNDQVRHYRRSKECPTQVVSGYVGGLKVQSCSTVITLAANAIKGLFAFDWLHSAALDFVIAVVQRFPYLRQLGQVRLIASSIRSSGARPVVAEVPSGGILFRVLDALP